MLRLAALALTFALSGCVAIQEHVPVMAVGSAAAGISQVQLVVPTQPNAAGASSTIGWSEAKLTLTPLDGSGPPVTHLLEAHNGGLSSDDALGPMPAGLYRVHIDILQAASRNSQVLVATGDLMGQTAYQLSPGSNLLQVTLQPTAPGSMLALAPTSLDASSRRSSWGGGGYSSHSSTTIDDTTWEDAMPAVSIATSVASTVAMQALSPNNNDDYGYDGSAVPSHEFRADDGGSTASGTSYDDSSSSSDDTTAPASSSSSDDSGHTSK